MATPPTIGDQSMQAPDHTNGRYPAELIFTGGEVHTVNANNDLVEAVAGGGRILATRFRHPDS
jgi:hypothetical protein